MLHRTEPTCPELPELKPGTTLLETEQSLQGVVHALAVDHILCQGGRAVWVDDGRHAQTAALSRLAPDQAVLSRISVARGFTAFQHRTLIERVGDDSDPDLDLVVVPAIDHRYRAEDLRGEEGRDLLVDGVAALAGVARRESIPVLVTVMADDEFTAPVRAAAHQTLRCLQTSLGPRFVGEDVETLVYPQGDGTVQTTLSFWAEVLTERRPEHTTSPQSGTTVHQEAIVYGSD